MKSISATPDSVRMSRLRAATDASFCSMSSVTTAGSVSIGSGGPACCEPPGAASGTEGMNSRAMTVSRASPVSGSPLPISATRPARVAGDARRAVTSTNSLPPASYMRGRAVSCHIESPRGFIGSVIIWPWPTET